MKGRWRSGTYIVNGSIVGTVQRGAGGDWFAFVCLDDWEDINLRSHATETLAKQAVEEWVESYG
jgi:hypothetical protein